MLNEIMEFESYVSNPESETPRLQPKYLTDGFKTNDYSLKGIYDVMTIVARGFLFQEETLSSDNISSDDLKKFIPLATEVLRRWSGIPQEENTITAKENESMELKKWFEKYPGADEWLKKFWIYHKKREVEKKLKGKSDKDILKKQEEQKKINEAANQKWNALVTQWQQKFFGGDYTAESSSFKNIIANAIVDGPLTERYLVFKKEDTENNSPVSTAMVDLNGMYTYDGNGALKPSSKLKLLKNIAAFLIWQQEHPGKQNEVLMQKGRLLNWYGLDDSAGAKKKWFLEKVKWKEKPIMFCNSNSDFAKFGINSEYIEHFHFQLIKPEERKEYEEKCWILKDGGHGQEVPFKIVNE